MRSTSARLVKLFFGQYVMQMVLHNRLDMRYEHKILIGEPKEKRPRGRSCGRLENNPITGLWCAAFHIHMRNYTSEGVSGMCVCSCRSSNVERWKPKRFQIYLCCMLDDALRSKWRKTTR